MAKSQENGITILLGLKGYQIGKVWEGGGGIVVQVTIGMRKVSCPYCGSLRLYGHGACKPRKALHSWSNGNKVYLELYRQRWRCLEIARNAWMPERMNISANP